MPDQIQADYNQLEEIASEFQKAGEEVRTMAEHLKTSIDKLRDGGWIGKGSDAFFEEGQERVGPSIANLQGALFEAGQTAQKIGQALKQAEEEASALFRS